MSISSIGMSDDERQLLHGLKPLAVTINTALRLVGIGRTTLYELIDQGAVETITVGRRRLAVYSSLEALVAKRSEAPSASRSDKTIVAPSLETMATAKSEFAKTRDRVAR